MNFLAAVRELTKRVAKRIGPAGRLVVALVVAEICGYLGLGVATASRLGPQIGIIVCGGLAAGTVQLLLARDGPK
jgi:hypothetical protein